MIQYIQASLAKPSAAALAITAGVFVQEDVTTVAVGMMAADLLVPIPLAMASLAIATVLNDFAMYGIGRFAFLFPPLRRWVESRNHLSLRASLDNSLQFIFIFLIGIKRLSILDQHYNWQKQKRNASFAIAK